MADVQRTTAVGLFHDPEQARGAIEALKDAGFRGEDINLLMQDRGEARDLAADTGTKAGEGAATGAVTGGILGGLGGWLVGIGALAIPGVGPFIAAGAFGTALAGVAVGAGIGAIAGALIGMGIPEEEAKYYEQEVRGGRTLVAVRAGNRYDEAQRLLRQYGAYDVESRGTGTVPSTTPAMSSATTRTMTEPTRAATSGERTMELHSEELTPVKERVQTGEVEVRKEVVTENRNISVPVTREEVVVERHPVDRRPADRADFREEDKTIRVPVTEERVSVEKQPVVTEEVTVGTRAVRDTEQVSGTVRHEEARIEREGDVNVRGWDQSRDRYRQQYEQRHGTTGTAWKDVEPAYRYGYEFRQQPEYRTRSWADAEPALRRDWEQRYPDRPWDRARESVRETWDDKTS